MTNEETRELALRLLRADSEDEVVRILKDADYWDDKACWRLYGDKEGNWSQIGNQQTYPEASLVEKVINSVDARLLLESHLREIDPESSEAPTNIRDAVAMFFEDRRSKGNEAGTLSEWSAKKRLEESRNITLAVTGGKPTRGTRTKKMCVTITDQGEGQSPRRLPDTIISLNKKNKQYIRFVQGKFNMGGSGALRFCGSKGIQLIISRRHPTLAEKEAGNDPTTDSWGVTVTRREEPTDAVGESVHSEFTYLAPNGAKDNPRKGDVLSFRADSLPLMPSQNEAYKTEVTFGTAIKLYEYQTAVGQSNVLLPDGLLFALERLMPEVALPLRMHECRDYGGAKERSYETTIAGLVVRLEAGKGDNLEFSHTASLLAANTHMTARIYAFQEEKAKTYLKDEGVIFQINGQSHGHLPKSIFLRKKVKLPRLRDSLLVLVDCSGLSTRQREDLFMTSRDRLSDSAIRRDIEEEIMEMLASDQALRELQNKRRNQDVESKLSEERPLAEVLNKVLRSSPTLTTLFLAGQRLPKPFKKGQGSGGGLEPGQLGGPKREAEEKEFIGRRHPTYFVTKGVEYGQIYRRNCELGRRCRVDFLTDVENDYFHRATDRGTFDIEIIDADHIAAPGGHFLLEDGEAHLSFTLPPEAEVGDAFTLQVSINDSTLTEPFVNLIRLRVLPKSPKKKAASQKRPKAGGGSGDQGKAPGFDIPEVIPVREGDEHWHRHKFDPGTACHVETDPVTQEDGTSVDQHVFYINCDNASLKTEMKYAKRQNPRLLEAKFKYGNVLLALAMLHEDGKADDSHTANASINEESNGQPTIQERIRAYSSAVAPVLLPMIEQLSGLHEDELEDLEVAVAD